MKIAKNKGIDGKVIFRLYMSEEETEEFKWFVFKITDIDPEGHIIASFVDESDARNYYDVVTGRAVVVTQSRFNNLYKELKNPRRRG